MTKENCVHFHTGSGPIKYDSAACKRQQDLRKDACLKCSFRRPAKAAKALVPAVASLHIPSMTDLHNELFLQLKRLNSSDLNGDEMKAEIERSRAVTGLGQTIINNADFVLKAHLSVANSIGDVSMPTLVHGQEVIDLEGVDDEGVDDGKAI